MPKSIVVNATPKKACTIRIKCAAIAVSGRGAEVLSAAADSNAGCALRSHAERPQFKTQRDRSNDDDRPHLSSVDHCIGIACSRKAMAMWSCTAIAPPRIEKGAIPNVDWSIPKVPVISIAPGNASIFTAGSTICVTP